MDDYLFFTGLMIMVFISAAATCLAQNGTMATVNVMGSLYANGVMVGQAIAGVLPSSALIISILIVGDKKADADKENQYMDKNYGVFIYYITASLIAVLSISLLYFTNHYKIESTYKTLNHMVEEQQPLNSSDDDSEGEPEVTQKKYVPFMVLWSKLKLIVLTIFLTFGITLIFPVFASTVESVHKDSDHTLLQRKIFIPFIYLVWNLGDFLGRVCCGKPRLAVLIKNPKVLLMYSIARLIFIPLFLTCNVNSASSGKSNAIINSDTWYIMLQFLFGLSNGQLCTSCFMIVGNNCDTDDEKEAAGGFTTVFLSVGLAFGSVFSYLLVLMIN
jgi:equilibrative nucleoside transporter 1/2/3